MPTYAPGTPQNGGNVTTSAALSNPNYTPGNSLSGPTQPTGLTPANAAGSTPSPYTPTALTPSSVQGTPNITNFTNATTPPIYNTSSLGTPALGGEQQKAQDYTTMLEGLNNTLAGKGQFEANAYNQLGVGYTLDANGNFVANDPVISQLNSQLTELKNQSQIIPLDAQNRMNGSLATQMSGLDSTALRNNAIQSLTLGAQIAARQGKLAYATQLVQNAVAEKYAQTEVAYKTLSNNLALIQKSPEYDQETKTAANEATLQLQAAQAQLDLQKQNYTNAQNEILKYAPIANADVLNAMQQAANKGATPAQIGAMAAQAGLQQPQAGRYQQVTSTLTDAFGNQYQQSKIFDTLTGQYVQGGGKTAQQMNTDSGSNAPGPYQPPTQNGGTNGGSSNIAAPGTTNKYGASFDQYGLLSKSDFNPNTSVDQLAQNYIDTYLKNGTVPTASTLGRNLKPAAFAQIRTRADNLYFQATGGHLPLPAEIQGLQKQLVGNEALLNNLNVQEGTIKANADLLNQNITAANLNQNAPAINQVVDWWKNQLGNPDTAAFLAQNSTLQTELGALLALKNAQGTTVHDKLVAAGLITNNYNAGQIAGVVNNLMKEAANARQAITTANAPLYAKIDPLAQLPDNPLRQQQLQSQSKYPSQINYNGKTYNVDPQTGDMTPVQ